MTEDNTGDLTTDEKLDLLIARVSAIEAQSTDTTRPLLDRIIQEVIETRERLLEEIAAVRREFSIITADVIALRARSDHAERRLNALEQRPN